MVRVSTCCGCCGLKVGLYVYAVIILILRGLAFISLFVSKERKNLYNEEPYVNGCYIILAVILLIVALVGINKQRSGFLIPYMGMMVLEIIFGIAFSLWGTFAISPLFLLVILFGVCPEIYAFICFYSHYQEIEEQISGSAFRNPYDVEALKQ